MRTPIRIAIALFVAAGAAQATDCKPVHASLVEVASTTGCNPGLSSCFLGEVTGNHGLAGVTHFRADSVGAAASGSPGSVPYSGPFEYRTERGHLLMRETGVTVPGAVTAHQRIVEGSGDFAGVTGYLFVSGTRANGVITTRVDGEFCYPD